MPESYFNRLKNTLLQRKLFLFLSIFIIVIIVLLFSNDGIIKRVELELKKKQIIAGLAAERRTRDSLLRFIQLLERDTTEIERIAREKYGMLRPGEKVYFIRNNDKK